MSFHVLFDEEGWNVNDIKHSHFEIVNVAFVHLRMKQIIALEDLDQIDAESEFMFFVLNI